ncbi:hypothetical protein HY214_03270 [Candidatus Roizmanbacteria bacterium]|nr:hypothetical protein [Candidatus Roizmanbacteria bacterium]
MDKFREPGTKSLTEFTTTGLSLEPKRRMASATGRFYNSLIDTYLTAQTPEERQIEIDKLVAGLPDPMQKLYREGLHKFQEELEENHTLLERHRGNEVRYLLEMVMTSEGRSAEEKEQILARCSQAAFSEPAPGVAVVQTEQDFFEFLKEHGLVLVEAGAVHFGGDNRSLPSFLIVKRMSLEKSFAEDGTQMKGDGFVRHEFHHFLWNFLERRGDFLRKTAESSPTLTTAFSHFKDEVAAYIIDRGGPGDIGADILTYSDDEEILKTARDVRDLITVCIEIAKGKDVDPQEFLYASMSARSFAELKDGFVDLTPLDKIDSGGVAALYSAWTGDNTFFGTYYKERPQVVELLRRKKLTVPALLIEEFGVKHIASAAITSMERIFSEIRYVKKFADVIGADSVNEEQLLEKAIRSRLPLPKETVDVILSLPHEQIIRVPLNKSGEEFLQSFIVFGRINEESERAVYQQVINSSPVMRQAFEQARERIISRGTELWRPDYESSTEDAKRRAESRRQEIVRWLREL